MNTYPLVFREHFVQLIKENNAYKAVQLSFPQGKILEKHKTSSHLLLVVVSGQIQVNADEDVLLQADHLVSLEPNVEHSVEAMEDSIILLILTPVPDRSYGGSTDEPT
jgi:quercetin dioxygenase-like cupin family protein